MAKPKVLNFSITVKWKALFAKRVGCKLICIYNFKDKEYAEFYHEAWSKSSDVEKISKDW